MLIHMFTFGPDHHPVPNAVVSIIGCGPEAARSIMFSLHLNKWSSQYSGEDEINQYVAKYPVTVVQVVQVTDAAHQPA